MSTVLASYHAHGAVAYNDFVAFIYDIENINTNNIHHKLQKEVFEKNKLRPKDILKYFNTSRSYSSGYVKTIEFEMKAKNSQNFCI